MLPQKWYGFSEEVDATGIATPTYRSNTATRAASDCLRHFVDKEPTSLG
jgi:hypothetical protein